MRNCIPGLTTGSVQYKTSRHYRPSVEYLWEFFSRYTGSKNSAWRLKKVCCKDCIPFFPLFLSPSRIVQKQIDLGKKNCFLGLPITPSRPLPVLASRRPVSVSETATVALDEARICLAGQARWTSIKKSFEMWVPFSMLAKATQSWFTSAETSCPMDIRGWFDARDYYASFTTLCDRQFLNNAQVNLSGKRE